jgi:hypothetical protein
MPSGHLDEEQLERYSMGATPETELAPVEEHLLICEPCREALGDADSYVNAMRSAAKRLHREEKRPWWAFFPNPAWAGALAAAAVAVLAVGLWFRPGGGGPVAVALESTRGAESSVFAPAPAGKVLVLSLDPGDLPLAAAYRVEVVDEGGRRVWQGNTTPAATRLTVTGPRLRGGHYYVRLYASSGELLREYGVESN